MTLIRRIWSSRRGPEVLAGFGAIIAILVVFAVAPRLGPVLLVLLPSLVFLAVLALRFPLVAVLLLVVVSFVREPLNDLGLGDPLMAAFYGTMISLGVALLLRTIRVPRLGLVEALVGAYVLWNLLSVLLPQHYPAVDAWRFIVTGTVLPFVLYLAGRMLFDQEHAIRPLLWMVVVFTVYSSLMAVFQFRGPTWLVWPRFIADDPAWPGRAVGIFNQPVTNGLLLVIGFAVALFLAAQPGTGWWTRYALWASAALAAVGVYLTHTRSAWLALVVVVVLGAVVARGWRAGFVASLVVGAVGVAASWRALVGADRDAGGVGSTNEVYDRLNIMATSLRAIDEHPIFGVGIGRFVAYNTDNHVAWSQHIDWSRGWAIVSHENELGIAAELGVLGGLLWVAILVLVASKLVVAWRRLPVGGVAGKGFALVALFSLTAWETNAVTVDMRFLGFTGTLPWLLFGIAVGASDRFHARQGPDSSLPITRPAARPLTPPARTLVTAR